LGLAATMSLAKADRTPVTRSGLYYRPGSAKARVAVAGAED